MKRRITKHPSYREAIEYVALNDEATALEPETMLGQPTIHLISVIFGTLVDTVIADIIKFRTTYADHKI